METTLSWLSPDVLESIRDGYAFLDRDMRFVYVNKAAADLLGKSKEELNGRNVFEVFPQARGTPFHEAALTAEATRQPAHIQAPRFLTEGWLDFRVYPSENGLSLMFRDVTAKRRAEEKLAELAELRHLALELAELGTWTLDPMKNEITWDERGRAIYGVSGKATWPLEVVFSKIPSAEVPLVRSSVQRMLDPALREPYRLEHRIIWPDGSVRWANVAGTAFFDGEGPDARPVRAVGTLMDITARKLAEQRARILANASDALFASLDLDTTLHLVSQFMVPHLADWFSIDLLSKDGHLERVTATHVDPAKLAWGLEMERKYPSTEGESSRIVQVVRTGKPQLIPEFTEEMLKEVARDEEHLRLLRMLGLSSVLIVPLKTSTGVIGALTMVRAEPHLHYGEDDLQFAEEIARRVATAIENARLYRQARAAEERLTDWSEMLEQRVRERTAALNERNADLQNFASAASHDLQEPLRKIKTFIELLKEELGEPSGNVKTYLEKVESGAERMSQFITDLLALSRVTTRGETPEPTNLDDVIKNVLSDLDILIKETGAHIEATGLCVLDADATQMHQLFLNLIGNAIKFRKPDVAPHVRIWCEKAQDDEGTPSWKIFVQDNGIGFDQKDAEEIFQPFHRLHGRSEYPGTGMGLAIVQRIVDRHGGTITARSKPGEGSTFILTMPEKHAPEKDATEDPDMPGTSDLQKGEA